MVFKKTAQAFLLAFIICSCASQAVDNAYATSVPEQVEENTKLSAKGYAQWLKGFKARAVASGISQKTIKAAFANSYFSERIVELDQKQPEHKLTKEEYLAMVINNARIQKGRALLAENREALDAIHAQTGVEPEFIVALWGLESGFGDNMGNFSVVNSLATLAYEGRRREFFESELLSALLIIDQGHVSAKNMKGSWAGAMGQCQFMPSSFLSYAIDANRDGRIDIWSTRLGVLASIGNYLSTVGWGKDEVTKEKALKHWNRSSYFVASVFQLAEAIK